jgi:uncharacterized membrane protein YeaQ/YmgE (transglycosylase-associated protein family)
MHLLWFLLIGVVAGWLSGQITKGRGFGLVGDLFVGVIGAILGGPLLGLVGLHPFGLVGDLVTATVGAVALLLLLKLLRRK